MSSSTVTALLIIAVVVLVSSPRAAEGVTCSPTEMAPCLSAITNGTPPSDACCGKIREQKPCLCGYLRNPNLRQYVNNPNARKVASTCGVPYPKSC